MADDITVGSHQISSDRKKFLKAMASVPLPALRCSNIVCQLRDAFTSAYLGGLPKFRHVAVFQCVHCGVHHYTCKPCFYQKKQNIPYDREALWRHIRLNHPSPLKSSFDLSLDSFLSDDHADQTTLSTQKALSPSFPLLGVSDGGAVPGSSTAHNDEQSSQNTIIVNDLTLTTEPPSLSSLLSNHNEQLQARTTFPRTENSVLSANISNALSMHTSNAEFFQYYHVGQSMKYLAARGVHQCTGLVNHLSQEDATYHVLMAKSYYDMTAEQRKDHFVGKQMEAKKVTALTNNQIGNGVVTTKLPPAVPTLHSRVLYSTLEVDRHYLKNKNSIIMSLPIPRIEVVDGHAYVSPVSAIQHILAFAPQLDFITLDTFPEQAPTSVNSMWDSLRGRTIAQLAFKVPGADKAAVFEVGLWSDDYDSASVKRGRGSTWALTMTLSAPAGSNSNDHSVPLAFGHKSWSHMEVYSRLWSDLDKLKSECTFLYHGGLKSVIPVVVPHSVTLRDTPERRSGNCVISSSGSYGLVIDQVTDIGRCQDVLPSCKDCFKHRLRMLAGARHCSTCADWNLSHSKCTVSAKIPSKDVDEIKKEIEKFRQNEDEVGLYKLTPEGNLVVPSRKRTFELLKDCSEQAFKRVCLNHWSVGFTKQHMSAAGIPEDFQKVVLKEANQMKKDMKTQHVPLDQEHIDPQRVPKCPAWSHFASPLSTNIPVPMHLFFHGITNTCFDLIGSWLTKYKLRSLMSEIIREKLAAVEDMSLQSFKALETGVKEKAFSTGGYQAENFRCMALLFRWLFVDVSSKLKWKENDDDYETKCDQFNLFENLVELLLCITSRAMASTIFLSTSPADMDRHCKLFLSVYTDFQISFQDEGSKLSFTSAPNFGALINSVSETMKEYPPYRTLWEGGPRGEGLLRSIKKHTFKHSAKNHVWTTRLMERVYRFDVLRRLGLVEEEENTSETTENDEGGKPAVSDKDDDDDGTNHDEKKGEGSLLLSCIIGRHKKFCSYSTDKWDQLFNRHCPLSAIQLADGRIVVIRRIGRKLSSSVIGATITFKDSKGKLLMGGWFAPIRVLIHQDNDLEKLDNIKLMRHVPLLLLPHAKLDETPRNNETLYYCVTNEWTERSRNNRFVVPKFSKARYV